MRTCRYNQVAFIVKLDDDFNYDLVIVKEDEDEDTAAALKRMEGRISTLEAQAKLHSSAPRFDNVYRDWETGEC